MSRIPRLLTFSPVRSSLFMMFRKSWRWLATGLAILLTYFALKDAPWGEVWTLIGGLGSQAIFILLLLNILVLPMMTARWWFILRLLKAPVSLFAASLYRSSSNTASYLTPGPHFGGEPLLVFYLHQYHGLAIPTATSSVIVDRLIELLASVMVLTLCLVYALGNKIIVLGGWQAVTVGVIWLMPFLWLLGALFCGRRPFSGFIVLVQRISGKHSRGLFSNQGVLFAGIVQSERLAESLFRHHPGRFLTVNLLTAAHWLGIFAEFWIMAALLGVELSLGQLCVVVVVTRLAFYTPLPAAIGVLELALPHVTMVLGLGASFGLSLCLIIRFRDLVFTLAGLGFTIKYLTCLEKINIVSPLRSPSQP